MHRAESVKREVLHITHDYTYNVHKRDALHFQHDAKILKNPVHLFASLTLVSVPDPNQPQRGSLSVSRTGKEGSDQVDIVHIPKVSLTLNSDLISGGGANPRIVLSPDLPFS